MKKKELILELRALVDDIKIISSVVIEYIIDNYIGYGLMNEIINNKPIGINLKNEIFTLEDVMYKYRDSIKYMSPDVREYFSTHADRHFFYFDPKLSNNYGGLYDSRDNSISLKPLDYQLLDKTIKKYFKNVSTTLKEQDFRNRMRLVLNEIYFKIISHELTHNFQQYKAKGNHFSKKDIEIYSKMDKLSKENKPIPQELYDKYLKIPAEVWARFTEYLTDWNEENIPENINMNDIVEHFKENFQGYKILSPTVQKTILSALGKYINDKKPKKSIFKRLFGNK